jgi:hypothetical protein
MTDARRRILVIEDDWIKVKNPDNPAIWARKPSGEDQVVVRDRGELSSRVTLRDVLSQLPDKTADVHCRVSIRPETVGCR